ncbi:Tripartite tricarboxylate transporter family receptor [Pigmentiphaga humi]|uniref:Tripartite tricarboxylate transporter family receptor n=1 Tax=Pigmentiphaga humi TaxID=2478468 RepID=A0A3P4B730_9BURK|nr:tripartite tricarboxylate transporter substrate-binding protein [Pigmentiphaga humi]VCU71872.1 Tripartite tricarboxylate transporter family receptor [Pigmentiphaga humi]
MKPLLPFRAMALALAAVLAGSAAPASAADAPIRILVGFAPGGSTDVIARHLALGMQQALNRPVVVENKPGAGGQIAAQALKASRPDGLTLFLSNSHSVSMIPLTLLKPGYDPEADFAPVGLVAINPDVFAINPAVAGNVSGLREFGQWAAAHPGQGNVGVPAPASAPDFAVGIVGKALKADLKAVPYRGDGPVAQDVVAGQVPAGIGSVGAMLPFAQAGRLRIAAVNGTQRLAILPEVPTYAELGIKGYEEVIFTAMFAPAGTPEATIQHYNAIISRLVKAPEFAEKISALGIIPAASTPAELAARVRNTNRIWAGMVKDAGYQPQ